MKRTISTIALAVVLTAALGFSAHLSRAQEVVVGNEAGTGARAMGMGSAQTAGVSDVTAVIHNPAALARIEFLETQFSLNMMKRKINTTLKSATGFPGDASTSTDFSSLGTLGVVYPVPTERGSLVFAMAYNRVKDFSGRFLVDGYSDAMMGNFTGESIEEGGMGIISFAGAVDASPSVSFGVSLDLWLGKYKRDNRLLLNDYEVDWSQLDITGVDDRISAWSIKPAVLYFNDRGFRFGAYARLPMTFHIEEDNYLEWYSRDDGSYFTLYEVIDSYSDFTDEATYDRMSYTISAPMELGFGVSWGKPGKNCIAFDVSYENWSQAKINYPSDYMPEPNYFRDKYRSALNWGVGLEKSLPFVNAVGRIGYMRRPLIFKGPRGTEQGAPYIGVENERDYLTLGLGKMLDETLRLDVGYTLGFWSEKEDPRQDEESRQRLYVSITYRMMQP